MSKKISLLLFIPAILLILTACSKPVATQQKVNLTYWGLFEPQEIMQPFIDEFQKQNPNVTITYVRKGLTEYKQQIQARAGQENGPDIVRYHNSWVPELRNYLAITPQNIIDQLQYQQTFYTVVQQDLQHNRGYLGIPLMYDGLGLFYNKELFQNAGISKPPILWGDVLNAAETLKSPKNSAEIEIAGIAMGTTSNIDYWPEIFALTMIQGQASLLAPATTSENTRTAIDFYKNPVSQHLWSEAMPNSVDSFSQGKVAMIFGVSWTAFEIQAKNPNLQFGVVPVPQLPGSKVGLANYWVEGVINSTDQSKQQAAWNFLSYLASKETQLQLYSKQASTRLFGEPFSRQELAETVANNNYISGILDTAPQAKSIYFSDKTFASGLTEELTKKYADFIKQPGDIQGYDKQIQEIYTKYGVQVK